MRNITVLITANTGLLTSGLAKASRDVYAFGRSVDAYNANTAAGLSVVQKAWIGVGVVAAAALIKSVQAAAQFETRMRNVNSLLKLNEEQLGALSQEALNLARNYPQSPNIIAEGLYDLASAGFTGAEGMTILNEAVVAASAGLSDTETAVRAISAVINAFGYQAQDAAYISDVLFQTVNLGIVTFEELSEQLGDVVGTAAAAGLGIEEVGAAIATMTRAGLGADESAVSLNRVLQAIIKPSRDLKVVIGHLGYETGAQMLRNQGLYKSMEQIQQVTQGNVTTMQNLFPEIRALRGGLALLSNEGQLYAEVAGEIENADKVQGAARAALAEQMKSLSSQWQIFRNNVSAAAINVGNLLIPAIKGALTVLGALWQVLDNGGGVIARNTVIFGALAAAIGTLAVVANASAIATAMTAIGSAIVTMGLTAGAALQNLWLAFIGGGPVVWGLVAAAVALGAAFQGARAELKDNDELIKSMSSNADEAAQNIEHIWAAIRDNHTGMRWADIFGPEAEQVAKDLRQELEAISAVNPQAALDLFEAAQASGDIYFDEEGYRMAGTGIRGLTDEVVVSQEQLDLWSDAARNMEYTGSDAITNVSDQFQQSAQQIAQAMGLDVEAMRQFAEEAEATARRTGQAFMTAFDTIANFDPVNIGVDEDTNREKILENIARAEEELADAEYGLVQAQQGRADTLRGITAAEEGVADAVRGVAQAQDNLTEARIKAREELEKLTRSVEAHGDAEEGTLISVAKARLALWEAQAGGDDDLTVMERQLGVRESVRDLEDLRRSQAEEQRQLNQINRNGIDSTKGVIAAREALARAEEQVADASAAVLEARARLAADDRAIARANRAIADAQERLAEANAANITSSEALRRHYKRQNKEAEEFVENMHKLIDRGLDPEQVQKLLEAGPEAAGPIIDAMLRDHSGNLIEMANESETRLAEMNSYLEGLAMSTQRAISDTTGQTRRDFKIAMRLMAQDAKNGGASAAMQLAEQLNLGVFEVQRIADNYGIVLTDRINSFLEAMGLDPVSKGIFNAPSPDNLAPGITGPLFGDGFAAGGQVTGWSPHDKADNIPAWLTAREFVQPVASVDYYGVEAHEMMRKRKIPRELFKMFAEGGWVTGDTAGLHPVFSKRLGLWARSVGTPYAVGSGYRSMAEQAVLYDRWIRGVPGQAQAAPPGKSNHNFGLASDGPHWGGRNPSQFGLRYPMSFEPWHVEPTNAAELKGRMGGAWADATGAYNVKLPKVPEMGGGILGNATEAAYRLLRRKAQRYINRNSFASYDDSGQASAVPGGEFAVPANVTQWQNVVQKALNIMDQPPAHLDDTLRRMNQESSGNPRIVNKWDSNWQAGHPSVGLMQVIKGTYESYKHPRYDTGPYLYGVSTNPLANILASMRYALDRYGSLPSAYNRSGGYAAGGLVDNGTRVMDSGGMLPPRSITRVINGTHLWEGVGFAGGGYNVPNMFPRPDVMSPGSFNRRTQRQYAGSVGKDSVRGYQNAADAIARMADEWQRAKELQDAFLARKQLVKEEEAAHAVLVKARNELGKADTKKERKVALATIDLAKEQFKEAKKARKQFDADFREQEAMRRAQLRQEQIANRLRIAENRQTWKYEHWTIRQRLNWIDKQLKHEKRYSDRWMELQAMRKQELESRGSKEQEYADAAAARDENLLDLQREYNNQREDMIQERIESLTNWAGIEEKITAQWGNTIGAVTRNIASQNEMFAEWQRGIAELREAGLDEDVIRALGLDEMSAQSLGTVRSFATATQEEIDALNKMYEAREGLARKQTHVETHDSDTTIGRGLTELGTEYIEDVRGVWQEFWATMKEQGVSRQEELKTQGYDNGKEYMKAIAKGMAENQREADAAMATFVNRNQWLLPTAASGTGAYPHMAPNTHKQHPASAAPTYHAMGRQEFVFPIEVTVDGDRVYRAIVRRQAGDTRKARVMAGAMN